MHTKTQNSEDGHNTMKTDYRGHEIIWCADCGYFNAYKHVHLISDTFDGCKQLIDMSEGKLAHISKNDAEPTVAFIRSNDEVEESQHTTTE
jgi:hypothetical protein